MMLTRFQKIFYKIMILLLFFISGTLLIHDNQKYLRNNTPGIILINILSPLFNTLHIAENFVEDFFSILWENKKIREENIYLQNKVAMLDAENKLLRETVDELTSHTQLLFTYKEKKYKFIGATTLYVNSNKYSRSIIINKGIKDGVKINQSAVNGDGLVGIIKQVNKSSSVVQLIIDQNLFIGGKVLETGDRCLVYGVGKYSEMHIKFEILSPDIEINHTVLTSGIENSLYPAGLTIGKIIDFRIDQRGSRYAVVKPAVNFQKISNILLISEK